MGKLVMVRVDRAGVEDTQKAFKGDKLYREWLEILSVYWGKQKESDIERIMLEGQELTTFGAVYYIINPENAGNASE